jgi:hypothetical protein
MSIEAVAWALSLKIPDPFAKLTLISLANHAARETGHCWPTQGLIAKEASCDRRTVMRKLPDLHEAGYIKVFDYDNRGRSLDYQVLSPGIASLPLPPSRRKARSS